MYLATNMVVIYTPTQQRLCSEGMGAAAGMMRNIQLGYTSRGRTDKKPTSTLVIWTFKVSSWPIFFKSMGVFYFSKKLKKTSISILIANDEANTTP